MCTKRIRVCVLNRRGKPQQTQACVVCTVQSDIRMAGASPSEECMVMSDICNARLDEALLALLGLEGVLRLVSDCPMVWLEGD